MIPVLIRFGRGDINGTLIDRPPHRLLLSLSKLYRITVGTAIYLYKFRQVLQALGKYLNPDGCDFTIL